MNKPLQLISATLLGLLLFHFTTSAQCTDNLLTNPGFESGLTGWTTVGNVSITTDAHSGSKAVLANSGTYASVGQTIPATPGKTYTISAWAKGNFVFELRFMNASWQKIPGGNAYGYSPANYQAASISASAPAGTVYAYLFVYKDYNYTFSLDDACLMEETTAPCLITAGVSSVLCKDNGTPTNPNDDLFDFTVMANNPTAGNGYKLVIPALNQVYSGIYGAPLIVQNVPISTGNLSMTVTDNISSACFAFISVTAPAPCSDTGLPDLTGYTSEIILAGNNCYLIPGQLPGVFLMQINNMGIVPATAFKVKFYFSTDNAFSFNDLLWSTENVPLLGPTGGNSPAFISPSQPVPTSLANGKYFVFVRIDDENQVVESNETNNFIGPIQVQLGAPDVSLENYTGLPSTLAAGSSFPMQVTMKFLANGFSLPPSTGMSVSVSIEGTSPINVGTVSFAISDFNASNTMTKTLQVNVPSTVSAGTYTFRVRASLDYCEPINQDNFKDQTVTITTGGSGQIDLELSMVQNTANPVIYSNYTTTLTLVNKGPQAATGVKVKWMKPVGVVYTGGIEYVASQGSFNPNGDQVWTVGSVPANGTATLTVSYFLLQNGAPVTYAQVFAANETDVDSQPNNGTPPMPNQDDEAATGGSQPPILTPDLTISNLVITNSPVAPGQILNYYFDLANIGNGNAPGDFVVKAWISTSPYFNQSGIQDGIVPTGNFIAGFAVEGVPAASFISNSTANGLYYLHLFVDAEYAVNESNEGNNVVTGTFVVNGELLPGDCDVMLGPSVLSCVGQDANGQALVNYVNNSTRYEAVLASNDGHVISNQNLGPVQVPDFSILNNQQMVKKVAGSVVYSLDIPASLLSQYDKFLDFTEYNDGYFLLAFKNVGNSLTGIRTDANLNVQLSGPINLYFTSDYTVNDLLQATNSHIAFTVRQQYILTFLNVVDQNMLVTQNELLGGYGYYGGGGISKTECGNFRVSFGVNGMCPKGTCYDVNIREGHFENGQFVDDHRYDYGEHSAMGQGQFTQSWKLRTPDGGLVTASRIQQMLTITYPVNNIIHLVKTLGSSTVWEKYVKVADASAVHRLALSGNELVFLSEKVNAVFVETLDCLDDPNPMADLIMGSGSVYPSTGSAGGTVNLRCGLMNNSLATALGARASFYLSNDANFSPSNDALLASFGPFNLTPGQTVDISQDVVIPTNTGSGEYYILFVADPNNNLAEGNEGNNLSARTITVTGGTPVSCAAITITPAPGQITIAGFSAPHVLIKVFRPNWTVAFECLDNCANPLVVNGLTAGTYHLQVKLIDSGWGEICYLEEDVNVSNFGGGGSSALRFENSRQRLAFDRIYPNPAQYFVTLEIYSKDDQPATLDFYDQLGRDVHRMEVELKKGRNEVEVPVFEWKSGTYNVIAQGGGLPAYARFLKVWEE